MGQIYYTSKEDGGEWTAPVAITNDPNGIADYPQIVIGPNGAFYAVYFQGDNNGIRNVFAVTSSDGGSSWSEPIPISSSETDVVLRSPNLGRHPRPAGVGGTSFEGGADVFWLEADATVTDGNSLFYSRIPWVSVTSVDNENISQSPKEYELFQNFPNPFNPSTQIKFHLKSPTKVVLSVYDIRGNEVVTLINGKLTAGAHSIVFDASKLATGMYFYQLSSSDFVSVKKMIYMK
ncbi:MAG TPA: T9SS type A sorting domain-containing protein [bacterium]|nr:T9SS type A sorting domain-containing protein [bacterium]